MRPLLFLLAAGFVAATALRAQTPHDTSVVCTGPAELVNTDAETTATFRDNVVVLGNGIKLTCDNLKVVSTRKGDVVATMGQYGNFKYLLATGHVYILQGDREATCGRAEVFPAEDRAVLSENPVVHYLDSPTTITGLRIVINRGKRSVVVETDAAHPAHATLPPLKNLGFETPDSGAAAPPAGTDAK